MESKSGTIGVKTLLNPFAVSNPGFQADLGVFNNRLNNFKLILKKENLAKSQKATGILLVYLKE